MRRKNYAITPHLPTSTRTSPSTRASRAWARSSRARPRTGDKTGACRGKPPRAGTGSWWQMSPSARTCRDPSLSGGARKSGSLSGDRANDRRRRGTRLAWAHSKRASHPRRSLSVDAGGEDLPSSGSKRTGPWTEACRSTRHIQGLVGRRRQCSAKGKNRRRGKGRSAETATRSSSTRPVHRGAPSTFDAAPNPVHPWRNLHPEPPRPFTCRSFSSCPPNPRLERCRSKPLPLPECRHAKRCMSCLASPKLERRRFPSHRSLGRSAATL
jgi:hypothetical protein